LKYCTKCLQPDTRPNTVFNKYGLCPACIYHQSIEGEDWDARKKELKEIVDFGKMNSSSGYDCIIGVSGGKDSTRQALFVKEQLGMNPLLVNLSPPPQQLTLRGANNISNLIKLGFDCVVVNPAPVIWRDLMKLSFYKYGNPFKSTELALFSSVPRYAIAYQIPLIWWGENSALQLGESSVMGRSGSDGNNIRKMHTLSGGDISWILEEGFHLKEILQYSYPTESEIEHANIRITFLGYFWKDWSMIDNGNFSALRGLDVRDDKPWEMGEYVGVTALDEDWTPLNQMLKYLKYGFGRTTDYVNEDIRLGKITRDEAIQMVELYDGKCSEVYIHSFCSFIGITINDFWEHVDSTIVNANLFERVGSGVYKKKYLVGEGL
jgi:N-acetyl sugar amidotransferase